MLSTLESLFDTSDFPARWHCGNWTELHGWTHIASDLAIFLAYFAIPCTLLYTLSRIGRMPKPLPRLTLLFAAFIVLCGITHLNEAIIFWYPHYRFAAVTKAFTALVSVGTVAALVPALPVLLEFRSPSDLQTEVDDATRRLRYERDEARRFAALVDSSEDAIVSVSPAGVVETWSRGATELFGASVDEARGRNIEEFISGVSEYISEVTKPGKAAVNYKRESEPEHDGLPDLSLAVSPVFGDEGEVVSVSIVAKDITARVTEEAARRRAERLFPVAVEASPSGMIATDEEGRIVLLNRETERLFGYTKDELMGETIEKLLPECYRAGHPQLRKVYAQNREARAMGAERKLLALKKDGSTFPVQIGLNPIDTSEGPITLCAIIDRTEVLAREASLKQVVDELQVRSTELARSNAELEQFAYVASHDLRSPLRGIQNAARWLKEDLPESVMDEDVQESLELLNRRAYRMDAMLRGLLAYARVGNQLCEVETINTGKLVDELVEFMGLERGVTLVVAKDMPTIETDRAPLEHVLVNLIGNSQKHRDGRDITIRVDWEDLGENVAISVTDNGPGIEPSVRHKVFDIFQTGKARDEFESTGIGLAIVKKVVETYGGEVSLISTPEEGCSIRFLWPKRVQRKVVK